MCIQTILQYIVHIIYSSTYLESACKRPLFWKVHPQNKRPMPCSYCMQWCSTQRPENSVLWYKITDNISELGPFHSRFPKQKIPLLNWSLHVKKTAKNWRAVMAESDKRVIQVSNTDSYGQNTTSGWYGENLHESTKTPSISIGAPKYFKHSSNQPHFIISTSMICHLGLASIPMNHHVILWISQNQELTSQNDILSSLMWRWHLQWRSFGSESRSRVKKGLMLQRMAVLLS